MSAALIRMESLHSFPTRFAFVLRASFRRPVRRSAVFRECLGGHTITLNKAGGGTLYGTFFESPAVARVWNPPTIKIMGIKSDGEDDVQLGKCRTTLLAGSLSCRGLGLYGFAKVLSQSHSRAHP